MNGSEAIVFGCGGFSTPRGTRQGEPTFGGGSLSGSGKFSVLALPRRIPPVVCVKVVPTVAQPSQIVKPGGGQGSPEKKWSPGRGHICQCRTFYAGQRGRHVDTDRVSRH